ncbi:Hypothetical protein, putative [Bodo saltans]|uniref:Uncharacterized protein n=1 Tax=Bodo saltans TaxID=75058 RepID=A0A0S4J7C7_BODSA|nr:Hypothetical protein, putative [Bodo saltans]|eukprot:CUG85944.1 Hypothetical protein, putative [Bodo saltans]
MRTAFDALDGLRACRRHFFVLLRGRRGDTQPPMLLQVHCAEESLTAVDFSDFVSSENDEELFRDATDNAAGAGVSATTMMRSSSGIFVGRSDISPAAAKSAQDPPFVLLPTLSGYGDEVYWDSDGNAVVRRTSSVVVRRHDNEVVVLNTKEERMLSAEGQERHVHDLGSDHSSSSERIVAQSSLQSSLRDLVPQ